MRFLSLGLTVLLGLLCLLVSCKNDSPASEPSVEYYTVSFNSDGGSAIADIKNVRKGTVINIGRRVYWPERTRCLFVGWYLQGDTKQETLNVIRVEENINLVAKWDHLFTVTLEMGEGGSLGSNPNLTSIIGGSIFEPGSYRPFRKGFIFKYWYLKDDPSEAPVESIRILEDITLVAEWEEGWAVTFVLNGGVYNRDIDYITFAKSDDAAVALAGISIVRDNYVFDGWYYDADFTDPVTSDTILVTGNFTLYVKWLPLSLFTSLLGVWTAGDDGPAYYLYYEESRLFGFYFSLDDIRSFAWTLSTLDGQSYTSTPHTLSVGEGTFTPATDKRTPAGNVPLSKMWIKPEGDADLVWLYMYGGGTALHLSADIDESDVTRKKLLGRGSIRANNRFLEISYMTTGGGSNLNLLRKNVTENGALLEGEVLLRLPIEEGKPYGFEEMPLTPDRPVSPPLLAIQF
jgi:uncharacterized repeat protein (TIGR02543 family)